MEALLCYGRKTLTIKLTIVPDGHNHMQCVTIRAEKPVLLVSIHIPCKGVADSFEAFCDCLEQLTEIILKYRNTYNIILGGDLNEDLAIGSTRRSNMLSDIILEHSVAINVTNTTFMHPN